MQQNVSKKAHQAFLLWCDLEDILQKFWELFEDEFMEICREKDLEDLTKHLDEIETYPLDEKPSHKDNS